MTSRFQPNSITSTLYRLTLCGAMAALLPSFSQAQPRATSLATAEAAPLTNDAAFAATQRAANALSANNPEAAAALYSQLLRERTGLTPFQTEQACSAAARSLARAGNLSGALAILDEGGRRVAGVMGAEMRLMNTRARLLTGANRGGEAEALLEPQRQLLLKVYAQPASLTQQSPFPQDTTELLLVHLESLKAQGKWSEMAEAASEALWRVPGLLEDRTINAAPGNNPKANPKNNDKRAGNKRGAKAEPRSGAGEEFYDRLFLALQKAKRPQEALGWAKVRFEVCAFEKGAIDRAVASLRAVWIGNGELNKPGQFNTFLREGGKENPLRAIAPPSIETREVETFLALLMPPTSPADVIAGGPDGKNSPAARVFGAAWGRQSQRVSLLLLLRRYPEAAQVAQGILQADPNAPIGSGQIARVLKARDASLESGNRFYEFLKTGEGDNPLQNLLAK